MPPTKTYASRATDDFGIPEIDEPDMVLNESFDNVVTVDNIPVVGLERFERLCGVIRKIFGGYGVIKELHVPMDDKKTKGFCFIEYETKEQAAKAIKEGDNKRLDNTHKFRVNTWTDFEKYTNTPEEYTQPAQDVVESKANLNSWLLDPSSRDQYVVRYCTDIHETEIYWNDPFKANKDGRVLCYGGEREKARNRNWTESIVAWSPNGSYLATYHRQGIVLWGGDKFEKLGRFGHANVKDVDFSPGEKYMVTTAGTDVQVWDIRTSKMLRSFPKTEDGSGEWPEFKWSHDDKYFGRVGSDAISIYETPSMGLVDKKSIKIPGVKVMDWSPSDNIISYWVPEKDNIPSSVVLMEIPSRKMVRERHFYNVVDIKLTWQTSGDYLCVKIARRKTKKTIIHNFEIFRMRQKNIPVEVLEMNDHIIKFAFEPRGHRFTVIHGNPSRPSVSFHKLKKKTLELITTIENRAANDIFWSPSGEHCLIAGLGEKNGVLEFFNMSSVQSVCETEHHMCTDIEWDPSGRYVITGITQFIEPGQNWRAAMENGYKVWSAHGVLLHTVNLEMCYQVAWRPRPKTLLSNQQLAEIQNTLKDKYWKKFEAEDEEIRFSQQSAEQKERQNLKTEWKIYRAEREAEYLSEAAYRINLRFGLLSDDEDDYVESEIISEEELSSTTTVLDA